MNKFKVLAGLFLVCALMNLLNVYATGNGFSFVMGGLWLGASILCFVNARKLDKSTKQEETND